MDVSITVGCVVLYEYRLGGAAEAVEPGGEVSRAALPGNVLVLELSRTAQTNLVVEVFG